MPKITDSKWQNSGLKLRYWIRERDKQERRMKMELKNSGKRLMS